MCRLIIGRGIEYLYRRVPNFTTSRNGAQTNIQRTKIKLGEHCFNLKELYVYLQFQFLNGQGLWVKSDFESSFSTSRRVIDCSTTSLNTSDLLYPKTSSQLVVQKKKIEELKTWLETALKSKTKVKICTCLYCYNNV